MGRGKRSSQLDSKDILFKGMVGTTRKELTGDIKNKRDMIGHIDPESDTAKKGLLFFLS